MCVSFSDPLCIKLSMVDCSFVVLTSNKLWLPCVQDSVFGVNWHTRHSI